MEFEELLDRVWGYDSEIFAHDCLLVFKNYRTKEEKVFHNCPGDDVQKFFDSYQPILIAYNCNNYDKHILRCWLAGMTPEELKNVNDFIIGGGNGWDIDVGYMPLPIHWDLFNEINPRKALKEIEGNLRLNITETTIPFDLPTKWNQQQYEEVLYYCEHDVDALFPLFDKLKNGYKSKHIICKLGGIDPAYGLSQTNANLTAKLLKASRNTYVDNFKYIYPECIDINKIPKVALDYFNSIIEHNDLQFNPPAPAIEYRDILFQIGVGGGHAFKKKGTYYYDRNNASKLLCNWDFTSLYPNIVRLFGYSSRSQADKKAYVDLLDLRMSAKKGLLGDDYLKPKGLTNDDLKIGLKLPLNAYTGALRAKFNDLYDNLQGFSICTTGQLIVMQLIHDLEQIPTLEMVSANTDAVMFEVDAKYKEQADSIIHKLEHDTGLEMEEDNIVRIVMANVNNYCELVQTGENDYAINYKGGNFECNSIQKNLKLKWNPDTEEWTTSFTDDVKSNSLTIVGEALLKRLMLDIPIEDTINACDDIFRFQIISHLGSTYEKCVQESDNGDIELQRNNRIYAGLKPSGTIIKVKPDGRRDSLANCPPNPIVDNANDCTIDMINKKWYIEVAQQRVEDFLGTGKQILKGRKKLMKKDELIEENEKLKQELELLKTNTTNPFVEQTEEKNVYVRLYRKIMEFRKAVRSYNFVLDKTMDDKHGGGEYSSIYQIYQCVQETAISCGLDFSFNCDEEIRFEKAIMTPSVGSPRHLCEVIATFNLTDIDTGMSKEYRVMGAGSDSIDKSLSGAMTIAFRKWFTMNFTPTQKFPWDEEEIQPEITENTTQKVRTFIPAKEKEEIAKQVVVETKQETSDKSIADLVADEIMQVRLLKNDATYGEAQIKALQLGLTDAEIDAIRVAVENTLFDLQSEVK